MNPPRQIRLSYEQTAWILPDFQDLDFNFDKAKEFYKNNVYKHD